MILEIIPFCYRIPFFRGFMRTIVLFFLLLSTAFCSDEIKHECGVALVRLRKPISHYWKKYNDPAWGIKKLLVLMEKQRNRGQDGAGIALAKFNMPPGQEYFHHFRSASENALDSLVIDVMKDLQEMKGFDDPNYDEMALKKKSLFAAEVYLGHLRYATHSANDLKCCQPFVRPHYVPSCQFALAGNFNMTNTPYLFHRLDDLGLVLTSESDTQVILDSIAYQFDQSAHLMAANGMKAAPQLDIADALRNAAKDWDGGYVFCGIIGNGDLFACRDPAGIRPGFYFVNEEVIAVASEKAALVEAFDISFNEINPIKPGHVIVVKKSGEIAETSFTPPLAEKQCSFERIYFSKANDPEIYLQRKALGRQLAATVFEALGNNLEHTIFTYVPNSSISAFQGLVEGMSEISGKLPKVEYIIAKNQKIRTFITPDQKRNNLVRELYEVTKGIVGKEDTLVVIDDSIVRGTTLQESLLPKLIKLNPKKIIIVSSSPPVMYPDCYGIDISQMGRFIAFQAAISLLKDRNQQEILKDVQRLCLQQMNFPPSQMQNGVKKIYAPFTQEEISNKIAELVTPPHLAWEGTLQVIYQTIDGLHQALPSYSGDWYFSGNYPTPGGLMVLNTSFLKWLLGDTSRSY
jgi:amidophosphoribosyltransferase